MIERKNIIKILGTRTNAYHSAIITCYNFDPIFFESVYLPTLRRLGITNIMVLTDAKMYDTLLADNAYTNHKVGMNGYQLLRQECRYGGVFHTKIIMLFGEDEAAVIVGSGNITFSGMSNNEEVWNAFHAKGEKSQNFPIISSAWKYMKWVLVNASLLAKRQLAWIEEQCEWINKETTENVVHVNTETSAVLLYNHDKGSIFEQLTKAIGNVEVEKITVVSPFYDTRGVAIKELCKSFSPKEFHCVMDLTRQSAPFDLLNKKANVSFYSYTDSHAPLHAKIIEIRAENGTWLLSGSANLGSLAFGINKQTFNDEAGVLVHSKSKKDYICELGLKEKIKPLSDEELKKVTPPKRKHPVLNNRLLSITSCDLVDNVLCIATSAEDIACDLQIISADMKVVHEETLTTQLSMKIALTEEVDPHLVVFVQQGEPVSNYSLVVKEIKVENCNPDPGRRVLSSLLDNSDLWNDLMPILNYVEFENNRESANLHAHNNNLQKAQDETITVNKEQFDELKEGSQLHLNLHPGVRILNYLKNIIFKSVAKEGSNEDHLFELQNDNEDCNDISTCSTIEETMEVDVAEQKQKMRNDVHSYLARMSKFLYEKTDEKSIQEDGIQSMPIKGGNYLPKLSATISVNESTSFAIASHSVSILMKENSDLVPNAVELRDELYECACMFFAIYGKHFSNSGETFKRRKIHGILKDGTALLYCSLCYFSFWKEEYKLILTILNSFDVWKEEPDTLKEIMSLFHENIKKLDPKGINHKTYFRINSLYETYKSGTPIQDLSAYDNGIYIYRQGYGFFYVYDIKQISDSWKFTYFHPRYQNVSCLLKGVTKYRGYRQNSLLS